MEAAPQRHPLEMALRRLMRTWKSIQVELHGYYSTTRLHEMLQYQQKTSTTHAIAVAVSAPLLCLALMIAGDAIPLQPTTVPVDKQLGYWCRTFFSTIVTNSAFMTQFSESSALLPLSPLRTLCSSLAAGVTLGLTVLVLNLKIGFPTPFLFHWLYVLWPHLKLSIPVVVTYPSDEWPLPQPSDDDGFIWSESPSSSVVQLMARSIGPLLVMSCHYPIVVVMKIPLETEPFPPVTLTPDQRRQLQWLADALVDQTLDEYNDYVDHERRELDRRRWKRVMSRENVTMYKRHGGSGGALGGSTPDVRLGSPSFVTGIRQWDIPKVLGVGTMPGTIDDLLYGMLATTKQQALVRTSYIKNHIVDTRVLANVVDPSEDDPLRALVVRWSLAYLKTHRLGLTPRDIVYMESIGTRTLPNGERMGYVVMHSVELPECEELRHLGIVRGKFSTCYLFKDTGTGSVELYMRGFIEPGGAIPTTLAVLAVCSSLISVWKLMDCGQNKKLAWMLTSAVTKRDQHAKALPGGPFKSCPLCSRSVSALRSPVCCEICFTTVCLNCVEKRKLTLVCGNGELKRVKTRVCKPCIVTAITTNALTLASSQVEDAGSPTSTLGRSARSHTVASLVGESIHSTTASFRRRAATLSGESFTEFSKRDTISSSISSETESRLFSPRCLSSNELVIPSGLDPEQRKLWVRISQLRVAAEEAHLLQKRNKSLASDAAANDAGRPPRC